MRKYNWDTGEYEEVEVKCDNCGGVIDGSLGMQIRSVKDEDGNQVKITLGSCCAGKINAYRSISKNIREAYRNQGQISEDVLAKTLPLAPKPSRNSQTEGKDVHKFVDKIGRSKLKKTYDGQIQYKKRKNLKGE